MKARKCRRAAYGSAGRRCFNGAAPMKARKYPEISHLQIKLIALQWSRADEGAEMTWKGEPGVFAALSFNGAAPMKARKCAPVMRVQPSPAKLQWSRADEGAEMSTPRPKQTPRTPLQWSRADEGAEMSHAMTA